MVIQFSGLKPNDVIYVNDPFKQSFYLPFIAYNEWPEGIHLSELALIKYSPERGTDGKNSKPKLLNEFIPSRKRILSIFTQCSQFNALFFHESNSFFFLFSSLVSTVEGSIFSANNNSSCSIELQMATKVNIQKLLDYFGNFIIVY